MAKLKEKGLEDETIVVFTSDHGCSLGAWTADIKDVAQRENISRKEAMARVITATKGTPHDWSIRVPLIVRWPGRLEPRVSDLLFGTLDFMPTLLGLMGLAVPESCQGANLAGFIARGQDDAVASVPLFTHWFRGIYTPRHTYAISGPERGWLWDRESDPHQMHNVFYEEEYAAVRENLHRETLAHMARFGDRFAPSAILMARTMGVDEKEPGAANKKIGESGIAKGRPIDLVRDAPSVLPELDDPKTLSGVAG
jgi:arylsulfatase A-like enzyme